jgi:hypothetical protein
VNPTIKNTVGVPSNGYAVVRFRSTNPGFWFFRCHIEQHFLDGMYMVLNEAPGRPPPPPKGFSACSAFAWAAEDYYAYGAPAQAQKTGVNPDDNSGNIPGKDGSGQSGQTTNTTGRKIPKCCATCLYNS